MKKNKRLLLLANKAVEASFEKGLPAGRQGKINGKKALNFVKVFKSLPRYQAIFTLSEFLKGIKRELSKRTLEVETATDLSRPELERMRAALKSRYTIYDIRYTKNPSLLGGVKVKIGDNVFDGSVREKINQVKEIIIRG